MRISLTSRVSTSALARVSTSPTYLASFHICPHLARFLFPFGSVPSSISCFWQTDLIGLSQDLGRAREDLEPFSLPNLKELVVDLLGTNKPFPLKSFLSIFTLFQDAPLTSLAICGRSQTIPGLPPESYELLINKHAETLRRVALVKVSMPNPALKSICKTCKQLEVIGVPVPSAANLVRDLRWVISRNRISYRLCSAPFRPLGLWIPWLTRYLGSYLAGVH